MSSPFRPYFEKCFDEAFTRPIPAWIDLAMDMIDEQRELIASDFSIKTPAPGMAFDEPMAAALETDSALFGVLLYRIEHGIFRRDPAHPALPYLAQVMRMRTGMELYYSTQIGPRFRVMHGVGVVLGPRNRIGSDFTIYQGVTLGQRRQNSPHETMTIGNHCTIFSGAKVLGAVRIGDHVTIAANAVLLSDAQESSTYAGAPARMVRRAQ
jgi:serine O-acetyltransferase